jgi:hypothetical protein
MCKMEEENGASSLGRPPHEPTEKTKSIVKQAAAIGVPQEDIAKRLRICPNTLRKYYQDELFDGVYEANFNVGGVLYELSTKSPDDHVRLKGCVYWTSRRMGWKEAGKDDAPAVLKMQIEMIGGLPDRELPQVKAEGDEADGEEDA